MKAKAMCHVATHNSTVNTVTPPILDSLCILDVGFWIWGLIFYACQFLKMASDFGLITEMPRYQYSFLLFGLLDVKPLCSVADGLSYSYIFSKWNDDKSCFHAHGYTTQALRDPIKYYTAAINK